MEFAGYLFLPSLSIEQANAEANMYIAGFPALTAFTGFGHWLELNWLKDVASQHELETLQIRGVSIIGHQLSLIPGQSKCPPALHGKAPTKPKSMNPPIVQELKVDLRLSLVLSVWMDEDEEPCEVDSAIKEQLAQLNGLLVKTPLAGGRVIKHGHIAWCNSSQKLTEQLKKIGNGWLLCNRKELLMPEDDGDEQDSLDRLLDVLALNKNDDGQYTRNQPGWIIPTAIGYRLIESPKNRTGTRQPLPHAYAEPVTSVAQWRYLSSHSKNNLDLKNMQAIWQHTYDANNRLLTVDTTE
ncbi:hypothetical protein H0A36_17720 [Endozoicomonas sp. SM1973]|uniref:CRISPR-associated protein Csy2 n=1 Tax=Spartinivicinus marinus TaxID=2994442 RepID=A0A853IJN3_9GAMM|nr:type I-F CRISPR-associated protein Csy2 [Spartinivicinus marinus]MCX4030213.1 hypothetical protein [Spartinivicinus marinus]NYZ67856.1 hypothetical protein [Spartinivicinus marinus]